MTTEPLTLRRSARILAQSTSGNKSIYPPLRSAAHISKPAQSSSTGRSKRKAPATSTDAVVQQDQRRLPKKRRLTVTAYTVRRDPDPKYANPTSIGKARKRFLKTSCNPFHELPVYGANPYSAIWKGLDGPDPEIHTLPTMSSAPSLKRLRVQYSELTCVEVIGGCAKEDAYASSVYRVRYKGEGVILKLFRSTAPPKWVQSKFAREKHAYERLLHHGVCSQGFVPMCHGWFELVVPKKPGWLRAFASDEKPPYALLLEDIADGVPLDVSNISIPVAEQAMLAAENVHNAGVLHRDLYPRNTLVRPDNTVVIIDFDRASTWPHKGVHRLSLKVEKELCWDLYYACLLSDKLLGLTPEQVGY
ncbi:hypothetical protein OE88DRAFT_1738878 [Heliocybe sulcata]|uniref:Protein kinase domain-containing protein n=1 Tax=Heliocybe sulcata TaxID=5364 RepID=A0A5C3MPI0_9AGAM|nr:hypothetical protein OE88DRAFT_1738878 [Heliocybe sulcata]